ncbi:microtubule-associated protein futsch-like [Chaetodon trifascialis]|uniref:microtubule-associated protein futsch-like n=1 Tax=Chaetodon trifascialis TaxID=109706 RepID=UPI003993A726
MSHPLYNPYASGDQSSTQRQCELSSISAERDPRRAASHFGPGSSFSSSGASSSIPTNSRGMLPPLMSQSASYKPEQSRAIMDEDIERTIDMHISRAREGVRLLSNPMHQPIDQGTHFTTTQRDEFHSSGTGLASFPVSSTSASQGRRHLDEESSSSSVDWSSSYNRTTPDDSSFYSSSSSSNCASGGDGRFNAPGKRDHEMQSISGLGNYDSSVPDRPTSSTESNRPKYTFESAANILQQFGLEKEDLEELISYPEDQITPANLPFILRQIRLRKTKRDTTEVELNPYPELQPNRNQGGMDSHNLSTSGGAGMCQEAMSSAVLQPSKVIDYGHSAKYTGGTGDEIGRTSGSRAGSGGSGNMLLMDTYDSSRHSQELLQKNTTEVKSSAFGSSREQTSSVTGLSSSYSSVLNTGTPPIHNQTKRLQTQPNQTAPSKEPEADRQSTLKTQPQCTLFRGVHPSRPGLVLIGSNDGSGTRDDSKTQGQGSAVAEQMKKQQSQQRQKQVASQTGQAKWPPAFSAAKSVPPAPFIPSVADASGTMQQPVFIPGAPRPIVIPPALPQPIPALMTFNHMTLPTSNRQPPATMSVSKGLPTAAMMHDYAAASPKIFPRTCSLCSKECAHMKDWLSHQNTSLHLQSCKLLRARYPEWDGEVALRPSVAGKGAKPSASTSAQTSQHHHQETRHGSYSSSHSDSPGRRHSSEGRREKRSSRSRSPHSSRYIRRSRSRSHSPWYDHPTSCRYQSRSGSPERRSSPRRRDERRSPPRRRDERRSPPRRSDERRSPPRRVDERRSPPRRVDERRSPPRRSDERRSPPRRVDERRSPPRRSDERRSPQRRNDERRSPPRRVDERRSPPRRFDERRSPPRRVDERRSPPRRVDERRSPPRRVDERRSPARRVDERRSPLRRVDERRSPPRRVDERRSPPRRVDERRSPLRRSDKRRSPPRGSHESQLSSEGSSLTQKSIKAAKLAKKLLQSSVIKCLSNESDLDDVVKTLAPALVAELTKIKSSSSKPSSSSPSAEAKRLSATVSSSSSSCRAKKGSTTQLSKVKPILQKSVASSSTTKKSGKTSPPTMVRLEGIQRTLSHNDVITAVEHFGKTKSVVLFRSKLEALVCFEKEEDAQKLTSMVTLIVKGTEIRVVGGKETVTKQQKKPTEKEPDTSSVSKLQNAPKSEITKVPLPKPNMPQLKESLPSAAKKATKGKLTNQKVAAKGSVKGPMTVAKSKVLVSKAKNISTKQVAKKVKTGKLPVKGTVKKVVVKQKASSGCKSTADDSEQKAEQNKTKSKKNSVRQSVVVLKETAEGDEREKVAASEAQHQAKPAEDAEPMELGEAGGEVAEPMEDGSCAEGEDKKPTATEAVPENSADKPKETGPPASTVETRSTEDSTKASPRVQESTLSESESTAPGSKSTAPENQPESVVVLKETAEGDVSSERTVTEPAEDRKIVTEAKVLVSKAKMVSSTQEPQTPVFKLAAEGAVKKEKVEQPPAKAMIVPGVETSSPEELETKVEEGVVVQKETAEVVETPNVTTSEPQQQAKLAEDAEPMELGEGGVEVAEPMEDGSCAEGEGKKPTTTEAVPENSADKPKETGPPASTVETGSEESCVKASPQIQESTLSEPESTAPGSKPTAPENQPESVVVLKETAAGDESSQRTVTEPAEGREIVTEAKVLVSKAEMVSSTQEPQTPMFKLAAEGAVKKEKVEQPPAKATIMPDVKTSSPEEFETKVEEGVVVQKETAEVVETPNVTTSEPQQQAKLAEDAEPMELGEGGVEVAEPMEDGSCAEGEGKKTTTTEAVPENSADKPKETGPPASTVETGSTEDSSKASPRVQQSTLSEPGPEAKTEASQVQQQAAAEAKVETRTMQDGDAAGAVKTQTDAASAKNSSVTTKPTAAVVRKQQPAASTPSPTAGTPLTVGEMVEKHLHRDKISCLSINFCLSPRLFQLGKKLLLITGLPKYHDGCYTEDDIVKLLTPFGFQHTDENIYVVPQTCMAFVMMPSVGNVQKIIEAGMKIGIFFKGAKLLFSVVDNGIEMTPFGFYQSLMKRMNFPVLDDGLRTVFIRNISPSEVRDLQEALKKISFVKNFLPLLNKVFIEFAFIRDADRLGVWYSLLKKAPGCNVHRLKIPVGSSLSQLPKLPENALPDSKDILAGATIPPVEFGVPQGSISPFWVTMRTRPFLFPTISPWFIIPNYLTVKVKGDIVKAGRRGSKFSTIMLTGLPGGNYEHEDVAKLVQPYFPKWSFHSVYYSLVVLPLQRRAFVFFADWASCCNFVRDHMKDRFSVKGSRLCVHFILQDMNPGSSEEVMYKSLMKWSNTGVPESKSLEERLLCVEISETSVDIVGVVMEAVASIATVVGFLPLANRICVEMADSSGVKQVVEKCKTFCQNSEKHPLWTKVTRLETLKSLKLRLQGEIATESKAQPPPSELSDNGSQPGLQTSDPFGSTMSEPVTAGPSAAASSDASIEVDAEKSGTEIVMDSTVGPEPNKDVEESLPTLISTADLSSASAVSSRNTVPAASSPAPSAAALIHKEGFAELLPIDPEIFKVLTAAVRQHRLSRASRSHSEAESPSKNNTSSRTVTSEDTPQRMGQDDFRDDAVSSDTSLVDEQNFSLEDFVTVDEVGEDVKDTRLKPYHSSSSSPRVRRERQSSGMLSGSKHTSTRSSRDSKSAASSSSSSSKSTKGLSSSSSNSVSPKKATHSSEPTKLPTKPSSSAKPSSSSPPSSETISLPGQKTQQSKTKSPSKASNTASPGRSTLSSSTTHEREKITSAAAVEASTETHLEPLREGAKATEGAVAKSDHKVSAESNAAETLQAETKMGTEMHPPPPGHGEELSQGQSQEIDLNVSTINDQKKSEEDVDKHTEEEEDGETYQILDSFDDQTDEQMEGSSETQRTGPEEGQTLHKESYQDLDSADNKGNAHPEEDSDMEVDGSFQVLDSVAENQEASSQEDSCIVQDDRSTAKQVSEEDATPVDDKSDAKFGVKDAMDKDQETNNKDNFQVLDKGSTQAPRVKGDGKKKSQKEEEDKGKILIVESCKASKDVEDPDSRIPDEDQPHQNRDFQDDLKDLDGDVTEPDQEMFEILDSIDDHTAKDDDSQKFETPSDQMSKEDIGPIEEQEHMYQVIDSVEDQPTTTSETDNKDKRAKKGEVTPRKDDGPSKRSRATTIASKGEEKSPKKEDRTVKRYQTRKKMDTTAEVSKKDKDTEEATEEVVYKIVDSVGDELVQDGTTTERSGRRRSVRGRKEDKITLNLTETSQKPVVDEEAVYEILDSVEEETADDEPTVPTKSTRRKRERTSKKDALIEETKKENTSTRRRPTPARESQEGNREKTPKKEEKAPSKHSTPTKKSDIVVKEEDATNETLDSVEDKVVKDDRPAPARKRGRPRKEVKTTKRGTGTLKKADKEASETVADEEEVTYQILDSVEDETVDHQHPTGQSESSRRENVSQNDDKQTDNIASLSGSTENEVEEEEPTYQIVDSLEDDQDELTSTEVSDRGRKEKRNETPTKEEASAEKGETPTCGSKAVEESEKMVVQEESLYQIVDDLKEAPDDPSAAEESGRRNKDRTSPTGTRRIREGEERKQRSRRSSRGGDRAGTRKAKERGREREEKVEVDSSELVTLDEVGADEAREEGAQESRDWDGEITEGELQALVTLDEFVEEEEDGKVEGGEQETRPLSQEDESVDSLNPETLVTLDEAAGDEEEKPDEEQAEKTSSSAKRKHIDTEESMNFVTVDEVGEEEEEEKEVVATRTRGQARKRARPTPVRRSARGKKVNTKHETEEEKEPADVLPRSSLDASSSLDKDLSMRSSDGWREIQKTEVEAVTQADVDGASAGQELQPERPENQTLERCVEEGEEEKSWSRMDSKAVSQQRRELVGPEAKRSRSQSPCVAADFALPPFKPNTPLGHCSSQRPNDNLQPLRSAKRKQRCKQQNTRRNSRNPTTEVLQGEEKTKGMHPARPPTAVGKGKAFNAGETMMDNMGLTPDQKSVFKPGHDDELEAEVTWYRKDSDLESSEDLQSPPPERGRIQLFDDRGEKLQDGELADPNNWSKIAILRPGRVPTHSPFRQMSFRQATEIKSQSRMLSCFAVETPAKPGDCSDVRATLYDHCQGPWAEIEELVQGKMPQLVAYLVAQPAQTLISPRKGYYYNHPMTKSITKTAKNVQEKAPKRAKE